MDSEDINLDRDDLMERLDMLDVYYSACWTHEHIEKLSQCLSNAIEKNGVDSDFLKEHRETEHKMITDVKMAVAIELESYRNKERLIKRREKINAKINHLTLVK